MSSAVRENTVPVIGSVLLHGALAAALLLAAKLSFDRHADNSGPPSIQAVAIDSRVLKALDDRERQQAAQQQRQADAEKARQAKETADAKAAQEAQQAEQAEQAQKAEQAQQADAARKAEQARAAQVQATQKAAADKAAADVRVRQQQAQAAQQKAEQQKLQQQRQQEMAAKSAADAAAAQKKLADDAKARTAREGELQRQMAAEEHQTAVENSPLRDKYIAAIQGRITRAWLKPESARSGILCRIEVTQIPGGEVTKATVTDCNGDEAVKQSIENAVYRASPLPEPPDPALFQRTLTLVFKPND